MSFAWIADRMRGQTPDKVVLDSLIETLSAKLDAYEVILGKQKYLTGNVSSSMLFCTRLPHIPLSGSDACGSVSSPVRHHAGEGQKRPYDHQGTEYHQVRAYACLVGLILE